MGHRIPTNPILLHRPRVAIIGSGSFATALVKVISENNIAEPYWWIRRPALATGILNFHHNPDYLSSVPIYLDQKHISSNLEELVEIADWIILAIPAAFLSKELSILNPKLFKGKKIISVIKGMIPEEDLIVADFMHHHFNIEMESLVILAGPCHAEEIAQEKLSYLTFASLVEDHAKIASLFFENHYIRTQVSTDIYGTEYASVLKNIMSLASGILHGLGYGDNFQAVFIANAMGEIKNFLDTLYPMESRDINDSPYLGDLLVTAYSQYSRNRTFGKMIGKGYSVKSAQLEMNMIAEGYFASASIHHLITQHSLSMPILETVYNILYKEGDPTAEMNKLTLQLH